MPVTLATLLKNVDRQVSNPDNAVMIKEFYQYMRDFGLSESYMKNNLKVIISFTNSIGASCNLHELNKREQVQVFLDSKIRPIEVDPDCKWVTTWNDYLSRLKYFFRWLINYRIRQITDVSDWKTPDFILIRKRKTKRISPYLETEIWDREEIQKIIMYEPNKRNKAIIALSWDMDGRPHEVTLMQIKHVKLMERYGEAQVPHEGCGLTSSGDCQDDGLGLDEDPDDNAPDPNEDPDYD